MREFYTTDEATQEPFLFISYSHEDQQTVKNWADYLIDQGVRIWWDKAFMGGDDWETIANQLLSHENCRGILFFCSPSAIRSPNVAKEWRAAAAKSRKCRNDSCFYPQIVMVTEDPAFDYKYLTNFVKKTEELFTDEDYDDFRDLFGKKDHLYYCAGKEEDKAELLKTVKIRVSETVDEHEIVREKLADISNLDKEVILKLGTYGEGKKPVLWKQIHQENNEAVLLCQQILAQELGGQHLNGWLQDFVRQAFSDSEQVALQGSIRLLTMQEAAALSCELLAAEGIWWLADCNDHLQSVVREDGTIYESGYNNKLYKKGVRPVCAMDITKLYELVKK